VLAIVVAFIIHVGNGMIDFKVFLLTLGASLGGCVIFLGAIWGLGLLEKKPENIRKDEDDIEKRKAEYLKKKNE
jgi:membrane protein DedA with SNARE-associated domain